MPSIRTYLLHITTVASDTLRTRGSVGRRLATAAGVVLLSAAAVLLWPACAAADEDEPKTDANGYVFDEAGPSFERSARPRNERLETTSDEQIDVHFRTGHLAFETFGRHESLTHVELFPFYLVGDEILFADLRMFVTNMGQLGGNAGLGYRYRVPGWNQVLGASLWYDADDSTGELFHQVGVSLETFGDWWDLRSNVYVPVGDTNKIFSERLFNQRFAGTGILFDHARQYGEAMPGLDVEAGVLLPGQFSRDHNLRAFAGWYFFAGDDAEDINGFKSRVEGDLWAGFSSQVEFTTDDTFGTNVMLGVAWQYDAGFRHENRGRPTRARLTEYVRRNYNVIVAEERSVNYGLSAINPATGAAYVVQHVDTTHAGAENGAVDNPFTTIAQAQAAGGDIIYVHSGSTITDSIVLQNGDRLLGEGVNHWISVAGFGRVLLPEANGGGGLRPLIQGTAGDAVTLASNTEFSGFVIDTPTGNGITGVGVSNVSIRNVDVNNAGGAGIVLQNSTGPVTITAARLDSAVGPAFHIDGGDADIIFNGTIDNSSDYALRIENTTGGLLDFSKAEITDNGGAGILLDAMGGDLALGTATLANSSGAGIEIRDTSGNASFGTVTVSDATDAGIWIENSTGDFGFGLTDITASSGAEGILINNSTGTTLFHTLAIDNSGGAGLVAVNSGQITTVGGTIATAGGSAVSLDNTDMQMTLTSVSADGALHGISIVNSDGSFVVNGDGALGTGGLIKNSTGSAVYLENAGTVGLQFVDLDANAAGIESTGTDRLVLNGVQVTDSTGAALDSMNTKSIEISNSLFTGNGAASNGSIIVEANAVESYVFSLTNSTITDSQFDALTIRTVAGGEGATMNLWMMDNAVTHNGAGSHGLNVDWDGALTAQVGRSTFTSTGAGSTGIRIDAPSTTTLSQIAIGNNAFTYSGGNNIAVDLITGDRSHIVLGSNAVTLNGASSTGFRFDLAEDADVHLVGNLITDHGGAGTGFLFTAIDGPSNVTINGNTLNMLGPAGPIDRGIIFTSVTGTVQLFGTQNNVINGATTPFSAPGGSTTGSILVNGVWVP